MEINIETKNKKIIIFWLITLLFAIFLMVIIGGLTRLTDSGLSMVEWKPFLGFLPPLNDKEWERVFKLYKSSAEYKFYNIGMEISEFKKIFFWEYVHRLFGRLIGILFFIPFTFFVIKKMISNSIIYRLLIILFFGSIQGLIGWWMVKSGLAENPYISQYRLSIHLANAFLIMFLILWLIMDFYEGVSRIKFNFNLLILFVLSITIIAGAFVAGMDAGLMYNTYPLMNGKILPEHYGQLGYLDPLENPGSIQFHHRHLGLLTLIGLFFVFFANKKNSYLKKRLYALLILALSQFGLGIFILLKFVPIAFASMHQIGAMMIFLLLTSIIHSQNIKN